MLSTDASLELFDLGLGEPGYEMRVAGQIALKDRSVIHFLLLHFVFNWFPSQFVCTLCVALLFSLSLSLSLSHSLSLSLSLYTCRTLSKVLNFRNIQYYSTFTYYGSLKIHKLLKIVFFCSNRQHSKKLKQGSVILTLFVSLIRTGNFCLAPLFSRHSAGCA